MIKKNHIFPAGRAFALLLAVIVSAMPLQAAETQAVSDNSDPAIIASEISAAESDSEKTQKTAAETGKTEKKASENKAAGSEETAAETQTSESDKKTSEDKAEKTAAKAETGKTEKSDGSEKTDTSEKKEKKKKTEQTPDTPDGSPLKFKYIYTKDGIEDLPAERAANLKQTIQTNQVPSWPKGPEVGAAGAIIMDADSGEVLYGKNIYMHLYPASITKVMTALLACENLRPTDKITFSENAVFSIERGSSNIGMDAGETITVEQALYGLMVASANEVAIALGEKVSGSESDFISLMNARAAELGCQNTHFVTANGLHDSDHYTCAYDMALIAREACRHSDLVEYMSQANYHFESSDTQPDDFWIGNTNSFLNGEISCSDVVGGKTGYTDQARETLVTFAERDGIRLVCVIMREEPPYQYYDTIDLLNYAFDNFHKVSVAENETGFTMQDKGFLSFGSDIFGNGRPPISIAEDASLLLPGETSFSDLSSLIVPSAPASVKDPSDSGSKTSGDGSGKNSSPGSDLSDSAGSGTTKTGAEAAAPEQEDGKVDGSRILGVIHYKYNDYELGTANVLFAKASAAGSNPKNSGAGAKEENAPDSENDSSEEDPSPAAETDADTGDTGSTAAADIDLSASGGRMTNSYVVPEEVHGIRALLFGLVHTGSHGSIYLNILLLVPFVLAAAFLLCIIFWIRSYFVELNRQRRRRNRRGTSGRPAGSPSSEKNVRRSNNRTDRPASLREDFSPGQKSGRRSSSRTDRPASLRENFSPGREGGRRSSYRTDRTASPAGKRSQDSIERESGRRH